MVVLGVDPHKRTHTVVAVDHHGAQLGAKTSPATSPGHLELLGWGEAFGPARVWAIEDCRQLSRRLEGELLAAGERVVRVPPRLMAGARRAGRTWGKSDPIDALAVARAFLREPGLPQAHLDEEAREVKLLLDHREDLVGERTRIQNRLRWHLHELQPDFCPPPRSLNRTKVLDEVEGRLATHQGVVADIARELVSRSRQLTGTINRLEVDIARRVAPLAPSLLGMVGCGALTAAKVLGETAGVERFRSRDAYAMWAGSAPIPVSSGNQLRYRLNRGGNRQLNLALHRIALTQARLHPHARHYLEQRRARGDSKTEALRALRRKLANVVYRNLMTDAAQRASTAPARVVEAA